MGTVGVAGLAFGAYSSFGPASGSLRLLFAFEAVVIGGLGSLWGTLAGGIVLGRRPDAGCDVDPSLGVLAGHLVFLAVFGRPAAGPGGLEGRRVTAAPSVARTTTTARGVRVTRSRGSRPIGAIVALVAGVVLAALPAAVDTGTTATLVDVFTLLAMATMWNLLAGYAGLISVGQQAFVGLGAYLVLVLAQWGMEPYLALPIAAVGCAAAALPISWLVFRLRGGYFAIATWVVADAIQLSISRVPSLGGGTGAILPGVTDIDPTTRLAWTYWVALGVSIVALLATYGLLRGRIGLVLTAIRDDEVGARSVGADTGNAKRLVYLVAAAGCGGAGALLILSQLSVLATSVFSVQWSAEMIFVVVIGGMGTLEGPILGTIIFFVLQQALAQYGAWYFVILGSFAIVVALWSPRGLWGLIADRGHLRLFPVGYWLWTDRAGDALHDGDAPNDAHAAADDTKEST